jgi:hypothetical protein
VRAVWMVILSDLRRTARIGIISAAIADTFDSAAKRMRFVNPCVAAV